MGRRRVIDQLGRHDAWDGINAVVAGMADAGFSAADNLTHLGATVTALDESDAGDRGERATLLEILGATTRLGPGSTQTLPEHADVLVTSLDLPADAPLLAQATARGIPVWSEVELAWRLRDPDGAAPWLAVTGTDGTGTVLRLLEQMLLHAGLRAVASGTGARPLVESVMDPEPCDVLAVVLTGAQLAHTRSLSAWSAAVLNVADDQAAHYGRVYGDVAQACVYNVADPVTEQLVRDADVLEGARAIGVTLGMPSVGMLGLVEDVLVDRAFVANRRDSAAELGTLADLSDPEPAFVHHVLAAAALARSFEVPPAAVREALRGFRPDTPPMSA